MKQGKNAPEAASLLSQDELQRAAQTSIWVLWWDEPERSWEAICLAETEADAEFAARQSDHLNRSWGKVGRQDRQSLLEWFERHIEVIHASNAGEYTTAVREVLQRQAEGRTGPVKLRTW